LLWFCGGRKGETQSEKIEFGLPAMIQTSVVFEGIYFNEAGFEYSPAELGEGLAELGPLTVYNADGEKIGDMIQLRRIDGCLEALIDTAESVAADKKRK
jgi:hypothetical protein